MTSCLDNVEQIREYGVNKSAWTISGKFFFQGSSIVRRKGFSSFKLLNLYDSGKNIDSILEQYTGFNLARVFTYTPSKEWGSSAWGFPSIAGTIDFLNYMRDRGFNVGLTLATDNDRTRIDQIKTLVINLKNKEITNLQLEAVNEPFVKSETDKLDPNEFKSLLVDSGFLYTSGVYNDNRRFYGQYWLDHSSRDSEWFRKGGHSLYEAYNGGGPSNENEPALKIPGSEDEPVKPNDIGYDALGLYSYAASCGLMGAGATFHSESGKFSRLLDDNEFMCCSMFLKGLNMFPLDASSFNSTYRRIVESNQPDYARTYVVGNYSIRIKQNGTDHPESGWKPMDDYGICWTR